VERGGELRELQNSKGRETMEKRPACLKGTGRGQVTHILNLDGRSGGETSRRGDKKRGPLAPSVSVFEVHGEGKREVSRRSKRFGWGGGVESKGGH